MEFTIGMIAGMFIMWVVNKFRGNKASDKVTITTTSGETKEAQ